MTMPTQHPASTTNLTDRAGFPVVLFGSGLATDAFGPITAIVRWYYGCDRGDFVVGWAL